MNIMDRHLTKYPSEGVNSMYMTAIIEVYSRKIVGWGISNTMSAQRCKNVLEEAIAAHGKREIVNSDQGSQYTSALWTQYLEQQGISI